MIASEQSNLSALSLTNLAKLHYTAEDIHVPDDVAQELAQTLKESHQDKVHFHKSLLEDLQSEYQKLEKRIEKMYEDYLDGSITESFYNKKREEFRERQEKIQLRLGTLQSADEEYYLSVSYLLKVANKAPGLFRSSEVTVKRQILKLLLQNCQVDDVSLCVAYRSPFDLFAKATSRTEWLACLDNFRTYCSSDEARLTAERVPALMAA